MKKTLSLLILLVSVLTANAKERILPIGMSLILPGSGELYLGKVNRGAALITADVISIAAYFNAESNMQSLNKSYKQFAKIHAGADTDFGDRYYQRLQEYYSSYDFNTIQELLARNYYLVYNYDPDAYELYLAANTYNTDEAWQWDSRTNWKQYKNLRKRHQQTKMDKNLFFGVLILNRVVSALDVTFLTRRNIEHKVSVSPTEHNGVMLNLELGL